MNLQRKRVFIPIVVLIGFLLGSNFFLNIFITEVEQPWNLKLVNADHPINYPDNISLATLNTDEHTAPSSPHVAVESLVVGILQGVPLPQQV